jgi:hypothetical protein
MPARSGASKQADPYAIPHIPATRWRPTSYINQSVSLARRRVIHAQRVAALRELIFAA